MSDMDTHSSSSGTTPNCSDSDATLGADGIRIITGKDAQKDAQKVAHSEGRFTVTLADETVTAEKLLVATGRRADLGTIGLDASARFVDVDERMRAYPHPRLC